MAINLGRGVELPPANNSEFDRFIVSATQTRPALVYRAHGDFPNRRWFLITQDQTTVDFNDYAAANLVQQFEATLQ